VTAAFCARAGVRFMDEANNFEGRPIGIIVLAAGASVRMNEPKLLLRFQGKTLLRRAAQTALESIYKPVVIVLGKNFERARAEIADLPVEIVFNENWRRGLSSSIRAGVEKLLEIAPAAAAVVITLADQPLVTAHHLNLFAEKFAQSKSAIIAAEYNETRGVPALFARNIFDDLDNLAGDQGAKQIIQKYRSLATTIDLPEAAFDIDTPQDYLNLTQ
jgi:molybdenum cofactor cytidylyltransferase